jgi:16S rRNA (guanine527-N7)-methyltransferase
MLAQSDPKLWFRTVCRKNGLEISDSQLDLLERYAGLLREWNQRMNLISRKDEENLWQSHLLHSVSLLLRTNIAEKARVLDLGTGGGLPGIPLKIIRPDLRITLLDSTKKKIDAVSAMVETLQLSEVAAVWGRAEDVGLMPAYASHYDLLVARAVASLGDLIKWGKPFLRAPLAGRQLITLKGGDLMKEILHARRVAGVSSIETLDLSLADVSEFLASDKKIVIVTF